MLGCASAKVGQAVLPWQMMSFIALVTPLSPPCRSFTPCSCIRRCLPALQCFIAHPLRMTSNSVAWKAAAHSNASPLVPTSPSFSFCCGSSLLLCGLREWKWGTRSTRRTNSDDTRYRMRMDVSSVKSIPGIANSRTKFNLNLNQNQNQKKLYDEVQRSGVADGFFIHKSTSLGRRRPQPPFISFSSSMKESTDSGSNTEEKRKASTTKSRRRGRKQRKRQVPTPKKESRVAKDWCAYLLLSADYKKTYVGVTNDIRRRLRQHNGELVGGAKAARAGRPWRLVCTVRGFNSRSEACQFEWLWKSTAAKVKTVAQLDSKVESPLMTRRRATLAQVLVSNEEWTRLNVNWHDT